MTRQGRYPQELRERAVRMVFEHQDEHPSQWAAITSIAMKFGVSSETLRKWVRRAETDDGLRPGVTTEERERLKALERENRELRRANEILKSAVLSSTGRCTTDDGAVSTGRWADGTDGPAGVVGRAETGAVESMEGRGVPQRDRPGAGQAAGLDPRRRRFQWRVRPSDAMPFPAGAVVRGAGRDLP